MKHPTILRHLILLTVVPAIALLISVGVLVWQSFDQYQKSMRARLVMDLTAATAELVHPLQVERGSTVGFLRSRGQKFGDALNNARADSDEKRAAYLRLLQEIDINSMPAVKKTVEEAQRRLNGLARLRAQATALAIPADDSFASYSAAISQLIEVMTEAIKYNPDPVSSKKMIALHALLNAKENAGQERALGVAAFSDNKVELSQFLVILDKIHRQQIYLASFLDFANQQEEAALKRVTESEAGQEINRMRAVMAGRVLQGGFDVDAAVWFKHSTDRINGLRELEKMVAKNIASIVEDRLTSSRKDVALQLALVLIAITIVAAIATWVTRNVDRSLQVVVDAAEHAVAHNDFSLAVPEQGMRETARVAQGINHLIANFRGIIVETTRSSMGIADASNALASSSTQINKSSSVQADSAASVAAAMEEVSVSISETAANAHAASEIVEKARAGTEVALLAMTEMVQNVNSIVTLIRLSDSNVGRLDENSKTIGGIVQVIKDFADQTNLLALNAAIEAARAGEQGRGFAVVADEVRKLAERTSRATTEITTLIGNIQKQINETVTGMQRANVQASESLGLVNRTEVALQRIGGDSREVARNVQSITDAIREQDIAVQQVAINIEKIAQMAEENSSAAASSSQTAIQLDKLSGALRDSVVRFKV